MRATPRQHHCHPHDDHTISQLHFQFSSGTIERRQTTILVSKTCAINSSRLKNSYRRPNFCCTKRGVFLAEQTHVLHLPIIDRDPLGIPGTQMEIQAADIGCLTGLDAETVNKFTSRLVLGFAIRARFALILYS
jgi:hypothetical protein